MYTMPKELATTMGIELTFVPAMHERVFNRTRGAINTSRSMYEDSLRCFLATGLKELLLTKRVPFYNCDTDPACVEVSTKPYAKGTALMRDVARICRHANMMELTPVASYTIGGGAHIHTGVMGETEAERRKYVAMFNIWGCNNPWMAWAFAGYNDSSNARGITPRCILESGETKETIEENLHEAQEELVSHQTFAAFIARRMHSINRESMLRREDATRIRAAQNRMRSCRRRIVNLRKELAQCMANRQDTLPVSFISRLRSKNQFIRNSNYGPHGTIEFRCFLMTNEGQAKHVAIADAICRHVWAMTKDGAVDTVPCPNTLNYKMKYSEAARGFNRMLQELGMDPDDFKRERVNMARRIRYNRAH